MENDIKALKNELQTIIYGKGSTGESNTIQAAKTYLRNYTQAGDKTKNAKPDRAEEERALNNYATRNHLFIQEKHLGMYITEGAEQKVFYKENGTVLYKIADAIFYTNWTDYFDNLLLHNYFFQIQPIL
jgi:hypothetical protein